MAHSPDGDTNFFDIVAEVLKKRYIDTVSISNLPLLYSTSIDLIKEHGLML